MDGLKERLNGKVGDILARIDRLRPKWTVVTLDHKCEEIHFESREGIRGNLTYKEDSRVWGLVKICQVDPGTNETVTICDGRVDPGTDGSLSRLHDYIQKLTMPYWKAQREAERDYVKEAKEKEARDRFFSK